MRCLLVVVFTVVVTAWVASVGSGHGGNRVGAATAGGYRVEVYVSRGSDGGRPSIDYTAYVRDAKTGRAVDGARVRIGVVAAEGSTFGPLRARAVGNGYDVLVPATGGIERLGKRVSVAIFGSAGRASVVIAVSGLLPAGSAAHGSSGVAWLAGGAVFGLLLVALVVVSVRGDTRRRAGRVEGRARPSDAPE